LSQVHQAVNDQQVFYDEGKYLEISRSEFGHL
jgi:hypothetical protein